MLYAIHDALVRPYPGQKMGPSLAESWEESEDGLTYEFKLRPGLSFHNGDPVTTEDVKFSFERYQGAGGEDPEGPGPRGRDRRSAGGALSSEGAVARLHDVLRHHRQRRRHRGAEEIPDARSATTASRSIRSAPAPTNSSAASRASRSCWRPSPAIGGACRNVKTLVMQQRARRHDAGADGQDRRGRHGLCPRRGRRRGLKGHTGPPGRRDQARLDLLDRVHRAVGPEIAVARQAAAARGQLRARPPADQRGGVPRLLPAGRGDRAAGHGICAAGRAEPLRSGQGKAAPGRGRLSERLRRRPVHRDPRLSDRRRRGGERSERRRHPGAGCGRWSAPRSTPTGRRRNCAGCS